MSAGNIVLRPVTGADAAFLEIVYASTRAAELAMTQWTDEEKAAFCLMQFRAQDAYYRQHYPDAEFLVIEKDGVGAGRLYLNRGERDFRIIDLALLAEFRGAGTGTRLLLDLQKEAAETGLVLSIHVEKFNPALRLYQRLGFEIIDDLEVHFLMEWKPGA